MENKNFKILESLESLKKAKEEIEKEFLENKNLNKDEKEFVEKSLEIIQDIIKDKEQHNKNFLRLRFGVEEEEKNLITDIKKINDLEDLAEYKILILYLKEYFYKTYLENLPKWFWYLQSYDPKEDKFIVIEEKDLLNKVFNTNTLDLDYFIEIYYSLEENISLKEIKVELKNFKKDFFKFLHEKYKEEENKTVLVKNKLENNFNSTINSAYKNKAREDLKFFTEYIREYLKIKTNKDLFYITTKRNFVLLNYISALTVFFNFLDNNIKYYLENFLKENPNYKIIKIFYNKYKSREAKIEGILGEKIYFLRAFSTFFKKYKKYFYNYKNYKSVPLKKYLFMLYLEGFYYKEL